MNDLRGLFQMEPTPIVPADRLGLVGEFLHELGVSVPTAMLLGPLLALVLAFLLLYGLSWAILRPIFDWTLTRRGVDDHSRRLLLRLINGVGVFFALTIASLVAGYGAVFGTPMVWIAALLTIGVMFRRRFVALLLSAMEYSEPNR